MRVRACVALCLTRCPTPASFLRRPSPAPVPPTAAVPLPRTIPSTALPLCSTAGSLRPAGLAQGAHTGLRSAVVIPPRGHLSPLTRRLPPDPEACLLVHTPLPTPLALVYRKWTATPIVLPARLTTSPHHPHSISRSLGAARIFVRRQSGEGRASSFLIRPRLLIGTPSPRPSSKGTRATVVAEAVVVAACPKTLRGGGAGERVRVMSPAQ